MFLNDFLAQEKNFNLYQVNHADRAILLNILQNV